jgi:hypothetical protein
VASGRFDLDKPDPMLRARFALKDVRRFDVDFRKMVRPLIFEREQQAFTVPIQLEFSACS